MWESSLNVLHNRVLFYPQAIQWGMYDSYNHLKKLILGENK